MSQFVIERGTVVSYIDKNGVKQITDDKGERKLRIKLKSDGQLPTTQIPFAFPLLPKTLWTSPKEGESVLVVMESVNNPNSTRYYIGPLISQEQKFYKDDSADGFGAEKALNNNQGSELKNIEMCAETHGSFPNMDDVSIIGRKGEDVTLKDGEIDIRCGIRKEFLNPSDPDWRGYIEYNNLNPAYIQLKHNGGNTITSCPSMECNSVINVVADKINLFGHNNGTVALKSNKFNTVSKTGDNKEILSDEDIKNGMKNSYSAVFGEVLVDVLEKLRSAILNHVSPYPGMTPIKDFDISTLENLNIRDILSNNVRQEST
jgi:hypothetical protein